jgi:hypothetical protein
MGTRHLIAVQLDGQYRIAQYGQWDGYPSAQGAKVLEFLEEWDRPEFEAKLRAASFLTDEEGAALSARIEKEGLLERDKDFNEKWKATWPELNRDTGAGILGIVQLHEPGIKLRDGIGFAANSLMCEWGYVLDLDANRFEVFKGFQKGPIEETERFAGFKLKYPTEAIDGYRSIRKVASYSLDDLPSLEMLVGDCEPSDEEEEE